MKTCALQFSIGVLDFCDLRYSTKVSLAFQPQRKCHVQRSEGAINHDSTLSATHVQHAVSNIQLAQHASETPSNAPQYVLRSYLAATINTAQSAPVTPLSPGKGLQAAQSGK